jgi:hypothetical protein
VFFLKVDASFVDDLLKLDGVRGHLLDLLHPFIMIVIQTAIISLSLARGDLGLTCGGWPTTG